MKSSKFRKNRSNENNTKTTKEKVSITLAMFILFILYTHLINLDCLNNPQLVRIISLDFYWSAILIQLGTERGQIAYM